MLQRREVVNMKVTLRAARINKSLTQKEAANELGISKDTLAAYEKGKSFPDVRMIEKIEKLYNVTYNNILFLT
jgi:transcriptional regulator with XRE-family HTH domain